MASQWKELEENFFTCSICLDYFKEPKQLPCLHKFCTECLRPVIERAVREFNCPLCKRCCTIPSEGIDGFETDFHSKSVIEYIQQQQSNHASTSQDGGKFEELKGEKDAESRQNQASKSQNGGKSEESKGEDDAESRGNQDDDAVCSFTITKKKYLRQHWYHCRTCGFVGNNGVCRTCVKKCHEGHDVSYNKYSNFFCDCGAKEDGSCQALGKESGARSAQLEEKRDSGKHGTPNDGAGCSFSITKKSFLMQHWYHCKTCSLVGNNGVCRTCVKKCHEGHDVSYNKYSLFFCDCGAKEDGSCQAMGGGTSAQSEEERDPRRLGTPDDEAVCSFTITKKRYMKQHWYHCQTCGLVGNNGVCSSCVKKCHEGHQVSYNKYSNFFCDCGAKEDGSCQALRKGTGAKSTKESGPGRPGTTTVSGESLHDSRVCTFTRTRRNHTAQVWYHCYTCGLVGQLGACAVCAEVCHEGHDLSNPKFSLGFFCDCGTEEYCPCKCLRVATTTASSRPL